MTDTRTVRDHLARRGYPKPLEIERTRKLPGELVLASASRPVYRYGDPLPDWNATPAPSYDRPQLSWAGQVTAVLVGLAALGGLLLLLKVVL